MRCKMHFFFFLQWIIGARCCYISSLKDFKKRKKKFHFQSVRKSNCSSIRYSASGH